jgi:hypothetical protein
MPTTPQTFQAQDGAMAAMQWALALTARLTEKGVLTVDEANEIAASAASQCRAAESEAAASLIEAVVPTCLGIDPVEAAGKRGVQVIQQS